MQTIETSHALLEAAAAPADAVRLLVIDSHVLFGASLAAALRREERFAGVEFAADAGQALALLEAAPADVVVIGAEPAPAVLELTRAVRRSFPAVKVLVLGGNETPEQAAAFLEAGAHGVLPAQRSLEDLAAAVERLGRGEVLCTPRAAYGLFRRLAALGEERRRRDRLDLFELTPRERDVLALLAEGAPNAAIAERLALSVHTVKNHVHSILGKLGAATRWQAVRLAGERGWLEHPRHG